MVVVQLVSNEVILSGSVVANNTIVYLTVASCLLWYAMATPGVHTGCFRGYDECAEMCSLDEDVSLSLW